MKKLQRRHWAVLRLIAEDLDPAAIAHRLNTQIGEVYKRRSEMYDIFDDEPEMQYKKLSRERKLYLIACRYRRMGDGFIDSSVVVG